MIALRGRSTQALLGRPLTRRVWVLVDRPRPDVPHDAQALLATDESSPSPTRVALTIAKSTSEQPADGRNFLRLPAELDHLATGDVISVSSDGSRIRVLWRSYSTHNNVLLTERCNHYCLMCSQPPKTAMDDWLLEDAFELIRLLPTTAQRIGFTGGEPTLYENRLLDLLRLCRNLLPHTDVHTLTNGRRFHDSTFASAYASIDNPNMSVGIPLYGSEPSLHDYIVQATGAFNETVSGILNLAALNQRIELRIVIHKQTAPHLIDITDFIHRNLPFVERVALMGLEPIGLARANMDNLWIDPLEYTDQLREATLTLDHHRIPVYIYNHQLCLTDPSIWPFTVKSISDWKNEYQPVCNTCAVLNQCGGFFHAAKYKISNNIRAIQANDPRVNPERATPSAL